MRKSLNLRRGAFIRPKPNGSTVTLVILNNFLQIARINSGDKSIEGVPYQFVRCQVAHWLQQKLALYFYSPAPYRDDSETFRNGVYSFTKYF